MGRVMRAWGHGLCRVLGGTHTGARAGMHNVTLPVCGRRWSSADASCEALGTLRRCKLTSCREISAAQGPRGGLMEFDEAVSYDNLYLGVDRRKHITETGGGAAVCGVSLIQ